MDSFRALGLKVPYVGDGPYYAVHDGIRMLAPLGCLGSCNNRRLRTACLQHLPTRLYGQCARYTIQPKHEIDLCKSGRYILGMDSHFVGLRIECDGSLFLTRTRRPCDNKLMSETELTAMLWETIFEVSKSDGFAERLTEGSGGSHLSAGIAMDSVLMDIVGGSSNEATAPLLSADILAHLPPFFFCQDYLSSLAVCSRYCLERVLDRLHWSKSHLDLETPEFQRNRNALRSMSRWWKAARSITISQHQLTALDDIPQNCLLRWTAFPVETTSHRVTGPCTRYWAVHDSILPCHPTCASFRSVSRTLVGLRQFA